MNDGDWICSDSNCGNINFARRNTCYRCNKERPDGAKPLKKKLGTEIGKSAAEKSRGLFNADDWQCNKCANVNWARRQTCNVCNAPKFGEVEARTGYGGGYNERGVVEYRKREPSSDDEYDEFGRKKRKRKQEAEDKVGITEGPVSKKLPPSMRASKEDLETEPSSLFNSRKEQVHANGSLSDGSICDVPPLTKVAFRRYQIQTQTNYHRQNHMLPNFKANGGQICKRFSSSGERDNIGSSGYEISSKICNNKKYSPIGKPNPVMENRVSSTNNDLVTFKFTGSTPAEDFQVTYSLEERVRVAAYAVVYNNCKLSTEKFEALFDKPAPDFKTIFAWRQRLLSTGCLIDSHLDIKKDIDKSIICPSPKKACEKKNNLKLINPDEIPIISDTDDSVKNDDIVNSKKKVLKESFRSDSAETLLISGMENYNKSCSAVGTTEDRTITKNRSFSECTPLRTRSSSQDSQDSNYPDSNSEKLIPQKLTSLNTLKLTPKDKKSVSTEDSDSDSISYNSDDVEFLSRVYGDGKRRSKPKKRHHSLDNKVNAYVENASIFQGYSTLTPSKQSPLLTANVYTPGLTNINVKNHDNALIETDGCSSEYIPTRVGSSTKKNYQEFKDNVMKKGFWAKGDGSSFKKNRQTYKESQNNFSKEKSIIRLDYEKASDYVVLTDTFHNESPIAKVKQGINEDFTNDDFDGFIATEQYTSFDKSFLPGLNPESTTENTSRIFEVAQSDSSLKGNKSIMDIFSNNDHDPGSPEVSDSHKENYTLSKTFEEWNEDDDALYNDNDTNMVNMQEQSLTEDSNIHYVTQLSEQVLKTTESKNKIDPLMNLLKTFQATKQISDYSKFENDAAPSQAQFHKTNPALSFFDSLHQPTITNTEGVSEKHTSNTVNTSKKIHIIESFTIKQNVQSNADTDIKKSQERELFEAPNNVDNPTKMSITSQEPKMSQIEIPNDNLPILKPQIDITNILSGINTNTLLLALQNLKTLNTSSNNTSQDMSHINDNINEAMCHDADNLETINLTNDEDWEKETVRDGSIERELEKLDGNTGDTPFLGDIFDPSPVIPFNVPKKLNINLKNHETCDIDKYKPHLNENAPVIGNFKSFALPKPVLLNRLKLTVKVPDKNFKRPTEGKKTRLRKKNKTSASQEEQGDGDEEDESGDEADLSKYDLWGSDDEKGNADNTGQMKEGESSKDVGSEPADDNDKTNLLENKVTKRSRSSSSSSSSTSSSSSSHSSGESPKNKFDDFNLNSERESVQGSPKGRRSRSRSPRSRSQTARRKSRDSRSAGESRVNDTSRDKEKSRDRERRDRSRGGRGERTERTERRYSRDAAGAGARVRHR